MSFENGNHGQSLWKRRQILRWGTAGIGVLGTSLLFNPVAQSRNRPIIPPPPEDTPLQGNGVNPFTFLREFDYGTVKRENGRTVREFYLEATSGIIELNTVVSFRTWVYNDRVPGPTLRAKSGDRVRVIFNNQAGRFHSVHFHGIHPASEDGIRSVRHDEQVVYEFDAQPYGVHLYHCHVEPVTRHIGKGLYGMFIIDPPEPRPQADEMVLIMGAYDTNENEENEFYAFNGIPNYYDDYPIPIQKDQLIRVYLLNMMEFASAATFHLHANMFKVYRTGSTLTPHEVTDAVTMGPSERHILEFSYQYPGKYMFHPHQDWIAEKGCMGYFQVVEKA
ncbi:MAG: multicopper oxidase domain-containing protein [Halothece sp. Uz-M2-17]|nr:multicopper oxidase domain-containing protein [Halothece sp. Uz-M2-17]